MKLGGVAVALRPGRRGHRDNFERVLESRYTSFSRIQCKGLLVPGRVLRKKGQRSVSKRGCGVQASARRVEMMKSSRPRPCGKNFLDFFALREPLVSLGAGLRARPRPSRDSARGAFGLPSGQPSLSGLATGAMAKVRLKGSGCRKLLPD